MKKPKTVVKDFLGRALYMVPVRVSLHLGSTKTEPLQVWHVTNASDVEKGPKFDAVLDAVLDIIAEGDVDDDEDETYYLKASWDDGRDDVASRPIKPHNGNGNATSLQIQSWRHIEACMRINASMAESIAKHGSIQMNHASRMVEEYGDVHLRLAQAEQQNLDRSHERLLEAKKDERQAEFLSAAMQGILACMPMFAGKLAGILPMGANAMKASPQYQSLKAMFEETPPEQWPYVYQWLESFPGTAPQKAALKMAIDSLMAEMIEDEKAKSNGKEESSLRH